MKKEDKMDITFAKTTGARVCSEQKSELALAGKKKVLMGNVVGGARIIGGPGGKRSNLSLIQSKGFTGGGGGD